MCRSGAGGVAAASWRLHPEHSVPHLRAATGPRADTRPRSWPRSTSTITGSCSASGSSDGQVKYSLRFPLNRTSTTGVNSLLAQGTHGKVLLLPPFEQLLQFGLAELAQLAAQRLPQGLGRGFGIGVGATRGLGDDLVDHTELEQVVRGDLEGFGGPLALTRVLPQDRRAALRRNHGIHRVLEHHHPVGEPDREGAAGAALADHGGDDGRPQRRHVHQVPGDRLGLPALLGPEPGVGAGRVHQRDHRSAESSFATSTAVSLATRFISSIWRSSSSSGRSKSRVWVAIGQVVLTRCTWSVPSSPRSAPSRSSATSTRSERLRSRAVSPGLRPPLPAPVSLAAPSAHSSSTGQGPGCAAHTAVTARAASGGGGAPRDHTNATPIAPFARSCSSDWAPSTMNGACSSSL